MTHTPVLTKSMLFSGPMILRLLDGTKTMTRGVIKPQPELKPDLLPTAVERGYCLCVKIHDACTRYMGSQNFIEEFCPHPVGSLVWCKETWAKRVDTKDGSPKAKHYLLYRADTDPDAVRDPNNWHSWGGKWKPSIFMPRWASRITLEIVAVKVERLRDISEEDAKAEGVQSQWSDDQGETPGRFVYFTEADGLMKGYGKARDAFGNLWDSINGKSNPWKSNCWVWVYSFKRIKP